MPDKRAPLGTCDLCDTVMPANRWYTSKGTPRLYCSRDCRNTANSRHGSAVRSQKVRERIARGEWTNPAEITKPDPAKVGAGVSRARKAEVEAGTWRNPALTAEARRKLSRPRKHQGQLHSVLQKLKQGQKVRDLTPEEREIHREYRRTLAARRRNEINREARRRYKQRQEAMTPKERQEQRRKWRVANARR